MKKPASESTPRSWRDTVRIILPLCTREELQFIQHLLGSSQNALAGDPRQEAIREALAMTEKAVPA